LRNSNIQPEIAPRGWFIEDSRRHRLFDSEVDAADKRTIPAHERHQVGTSIDDSDIVRNPKARSLCLRGKQHPLRVFERKGIVWSWHIHPLYEEIIFLLSFHEDSFTSAASALRCARSEI
jgi:hypothetical protein